MINRFNDRQLLRAFGDDFRRARQERGFSREILAELAGVHVNTVAAAERGEKDLNSLTETKLFADLAGLHRNSVWNFERGLVSPGGLTLYKIYWTLGIGFVSASPAGVEFR